MINYKNHEIDISTTNYSDGVAIIPLPTGEIVCIPEEDATAEEMGIIEQIKADASARTIEAPIESESSGQATESSKKKTLNLWKSFTTK
ncbi:hypothetical protein [Clostridium aminobutyricum]|uniref:Uncharacterized protein n=1 Tax=Clostridium aminobutyricum TaxID=33953 RepID=A0A939D8R8_CLOAM|nr:hypothetical protein [Clostridium aminobutyricum]MBN7773152.1 hypothetical protein [Clostridium aminobutyricum]